MRDFLIRLLGGFPSSERGIISKVAFDDGFKHGQRSVESYADAWKRGYRYAKDEWHDAREIEDAELAELAMLMGK